MENGYLAFGLVVLAVTGMGSDCVYANNAPPGTEYFDPQNPQTETIARPFETLFDIAERTRSPLQGIIDVNGFMPPYNINAGQVIKLPPLKVHVVQAGETFEIIADRYAVDTRSLANYNKIPKPYNVTVGQRIILPPMIIDTLTGLEPRDLVDLLTNEIAAGRYVTGSKAGTIHNETISRDNTIPTLPTLPDVKGQKPVIQPVSPPVAPPIILPLPPVIKSPPPIAPKAADTKMANNIPPKVTNPEAGSPKAISIDKPKPANPIGANNVANGTARPTVLASELKVEPQNPIGDIKFSWPAKGKIIGTFGNKPGFRTNDGIDIEAKENTPFYAAADGEVAYVGDQLPGYGWLILVKHNANYITAYAYGAQPKVKEGQKVKKGEVLGLVGKTGRAETPRLHFQIRENTKPTNPLIFLPKTG